MRSPIASRAVSTSTGTSLPLRRRHGGRTSPLLQVADLALDPATREVTRGGRPVLLSAREFALLHALMLSAGRPRSKAQLEAELYPSGEEVESNAIEVHVHHLRRKLRPDVITTIRGVGYLIQRPAGGA